MSAWPNPSAVLGKPTERIDGPAKVTGQAKYTYDVQPDGWLYGMILRSKWAAAKVTKIDLSKALAMPGVKAAVLAGGEQRQVSYYGQELAAVAATTKQACLDALRAIEVEAEPLPFVVKEEDAMKPDAPSVFGPSGTSNVSQPSSREHGQVDQAFTTAAAVVEGELRTPTQIHNPLETHGAVVSIQDGQLLAWASTQGISSVKEGFADAMQL